MATAKLHPVAAVMTTSLLAALVWPNGGYIGAEAAAGAAATVANAALNEPTAAGPVPELSTATSTTTRNADGSYHTEIAAGPINFEQTPGVWAAISNDLVEASDPGYAVENEANAYTALIPENPQATPVRVELEDAWVTMKLRGASAQDEPVVDQDQASFDGYSGADSVTYEATNAGLKETITLDAAPASAPKYVFDVRVSPGLQPVLRSDGSIEFLRNGDVKLVVPVGNMQDSAQPEPAFSTEVPYELTQVPGGWRLTVTPDFSWLLSPQRVYPVNIDPSVFYYTSRDTWLQESTPNTVRAGGTYIQVGGSGSARRRGVIDFAPSALPPGGKIDSASLALVIDRSQTTSGTSANYAFYPAGKPFRNGATWNDTNLNGATWAGGNPWDSPASNVVQLGGTGSPTYEWMAWDVTEFARHWHDGTWPNGLVLKSSSENSTRVLSFFSSSGGQANGWVPIMGVNWSEDPDGDYAYADSGDSPLASEIDARQFAQQPGAKIRARSDATCPQNPTTYPCAATPTSISYGPWPNCGYGEDKFKIVNSYYRPNQAVSAVAPGRYMVGSEATIRCGLYESQPGYSWFGWRHVQDKHSNHWYGKSLYIGHQWFDLADFAIAVTLADPDGLTVSSSTRYCYQRVFALMDDDGNEVSRFRAVVFMGATGRRLMTAFPTNVTATSRGYCFTGKRAGTPIIIEQGPRV